MTFTIYFNQKRIILTDSRTHEIEALLHDGTTVHYNQTSTGIIEDLLTQIQTPRINTVILEHHSAETLLQAFKEKLKVIVAGGGLVHSEKNKLLLIYRNGKWDLPKGKLDEGEAIEAAALREVVEETGLQHVSLQQHLTTTYHTYYLDNELILKESHWYLMKSPEQMELLPQAEEGIEKCEWASAESLEQYFSSTHPSIRDVLQLGRQKLQMLSTK